ncbi:NAD(P)H-dependent oxidoreductase [Holdemania massiliensis]|uniref:NAD(P)H-dependent oxidoreductase n=1 Tax=Holdemania massiliensis TaxID=1468449 RepID=UPI001F0576FE|nr:NAD(P)H-dependent oxidoreductase [Holdemania massiliensis]MCH1941388.1 NAD(P)H-dependent oxidoreductase [Holdemania massiliensis]
MMKILVLNGSPRGTSSNTYQLTQAFVEGMKDELKAKLSVKTLTLSELSIESCRGCFSCWTATPGRCVIGDEMAAILEEMLDADWILWSFPLYYYGMPGPVKTVLDRCLPLNLPWIEVGAGGRAVHPRRYPQAQAKTILISTCGFYTVDQNYEALIQQFDLIFGDGLKILCPQGELFARPELRKVTAAYLTHVRQAGREYAVSQAVSAPTLKRLRTPLLPRVQFIALANASWNIANPQEAEDGRASKIRQAERFTQQMAAMYNPVAFDGKEKVLEIYYTDVEVGYQLVLGENCELRALNGGAYTTRVETPLNVWQAIARGEMRGDQAMMEGRYKTLGDLSLLMEWDHYFSGPHAPQSQPDQVQIRKKTNMLLLILPWCCLWTLLPISQNFGGSLAVAAALLLTLAGQKWQLTVYDALSGLLVGGIGLLAVQGGDERLLVPLSYLGFGLLWLVSCGTTIPLSAHYVKENYHGDDALQNPVFMRANRILSCCWGGLYVLSALWTLILMHSGWPQAAILINTLSPMAMGMFTVWFEKWYPAKIARG